MDSSARGCAAPDTPRRHSLYPSRCHFGRGLRASPQAANRRADAIFEQYHSLRRKSENLGALPLIRRAVKTIIIVDAEHDPKYEFGAYVNLRTRLTAWNAGIAVPGIDEFLARRRGHGSPLQSYFKGSARGLRADGTTFKSTIHYFKMSMPGPLREDLDARWGSGAAGDEPPDAWKGFETARIASLKDGRYDCDLLRNRMPPLTPYFEYSVWRYSKFWNGKLLSKMPGFWAMNFPQYTTGDQSMYVDQAPAFIGLGYLQGKQFKRAAK